MWYVGGVGVWHPHGRKVLSQCTTFHFLAALWLELAEELPKKGYYSSKRLCDSPSGL